MPPSCLHSTQQGAAGTGALAEEPPCPNPQCPHLTAVPPEVTEGLCQQATAKLHTQQHLSLIQTARAAAAAAAAGASSTACALYCKGCGGPTCLQQRLHKPVAQGHEYRVGFKHVPHQSMLCIYDVYIKYQG